MRNCKLVRRIAAVRLVRNIVVGDVSRPRASEPNDLQIVEVAMSETKSS
jgi:hypothetical protein